MFVVANKGDVLLAKGRRQRAKGHKYKEGAHNSAISFQSSSAHNSRRTLCKGLNVSSRQCVFAKQAHFGDLQSEQRVRKHLQCCRLEMYTGECTVQMDIILLWNYLYI